MVEYIVSIQSPQADYADCTLIHWSISYTQKELLRAESLLIAVRFCPTPNLMFKLPHVTEHGYATALW